MEDKIQLVRLEELHDFQNHPYRVEDNDELRALANSIHENGVLAPAMARPRTGGGYELVSGHRRKAACELLCLETMPVIIRELDDNEAVIVMMDSNTQRESLLPSEKAFAYKMKLDAMKRKSGRPSNNSAQVEPNLKGSRSNQLLADQSEDSRAAIQRYIRLSRLIPSLLEMVDAKEMALNPAVEISYLHKDMQEKLFEVTQILQCTPSFAQAVRMKKLHREGQLDHGEIFMIMEEQKANQKEKISFMVHEIKQYFPKGWKADRMKRHIFELLASSPAKQ